MSANKYDANTFSTNNVFKSSLLNDVFYEINHILHTVHV